MYKVIFSIKAFQKLRMYADKSDDEISGLAKVEKDDLAKCFRVEDVFLLEQTNGAVSTKFSMADFLDDLLKKGEHPSDYRCWWHSHADMGVVWSMTDDETIDDFSTEEEADNWWLSILVNKKGKISCRLDVFKPVRFTMEDLDWEIGVSENSTLEKEIEKEIKEKVKEEELWWDKGIYRNKKVKASKKARRRARARSEAKVREKALIKKGFIKRWDFSTGQWVWTKDGKPIFGDLKKQFARPGD